MRPVSFSFHQDHRAATPNKTQLDPLPPLTPPRLGRGRFFGFGGAEGAGSHGEGEEPQTFGGERRPVAEMAMGHILCRSHFGAEEHPCTTYFDAHQGCRVLTHSQIKPRAPGNWCPFEPTFCGWESRFPS